MQYVILDTEDFVIHGHVYDSLKDAKLEAEFQAEDTGEDYIIAEVRTIIKTSTSYMEDVSVEWHDL